MTSREKNLYALIRQVRTCFNQLKTLAEQLHRDLGVNPSMRAVLESLFAEGPQTVSAIARRKGVSRQHIQNIMNALQDQRLARPLENPAHRRSPLFELTSEGNVAFNEVREREKEPLKRLAASIELHDLQYAESVLADLNRSLALEISKGEADE